MSGAPNGRVYVLAVDKSVLLQGGASAALSPADVWLHAATFAAPPVSACSGLSTASQLAAAGAVLVTTVRACFYASLKPGLVTTVCDSIASLVVVIVVS